MTDPIEKEIRDLDWKEPATTLDHRIESLFTKQRQESLQHLSVRHANDAPKSKLAIGWILCCAASLLLGTVVGGAFLGEVFRAEGEEFQGPQASRATEPGYVDWDLLEKAGLVNDSVYPVDPSKTQILQQSVWRSEDGAFRETYLTVTKRKVLVVDQHERRVFQMELNIPKTVVKEDPGI